MKVPDIEPEDINVPEPPRGTSSAEAVTMALQMQMRNRGAAGKDDFDRAAKEGGSLPSSAVIKYRCQYCGEETPVTEWKNGGEICPKCGRAYSWMDAQDVEDDP